MMGTKSEKQQRYVPYHMFFLVRSWPMPRQEQETMPTKTTTARATANQGTWISSSCRSCCSVKKWSHRSLEDALAAVQHHSIGGRAALSFQSVRRACRVLYTSSLTAIEDMTVGSGAAVPIEAGT
mmetsp:Transcript_640/g.891  ORF Transcript_640/g.891 Transcript_640/m.891 type:complete len:125 (-) Transcript_640:189-563(-)